MLIHGLVDGHGRMLSARVTAANGDEKAQVEPLLDDVVVQTGRRGRPPKRVRRLAADKGYDAKALRKTLRKRGIEPPIPKRRRRNGKRQDVGLQRAWRLWDRLESSLHDDLVASTAEAVPRPPSPSTC